MTARRKAVSSENMRALGSVESRVVVVTGGRDANDRDVVLEALDRAHAEHYIAHLGVGDARGVDAFAALWAAERGVPFTIYRADWKQHGHAAGPIRNAQMLAELAPDSVLAFPGGVGTADCVRKAKARGIPVFDALTGGPLP